MSLRRACHAVHVIIAVIPLVALPRLGQAQSVLPPPTGKYTVGTFLMFMVDSSRAELSRPNTDQVRRLNVQVWYPARPGSKSASAPYVPEMREVRADLRRAEPKIVPTLDSLHAGASWSAPPMRGLRFPLIVFSHGMNTARYFYTTLLQDLASHGFVIAAVDHPFWSITESFPDGSGVSSRESMTSRDQLTSDRIDGLMQGGVTTMAGDQAFVAYHIAAADPRIRELVDMRRVGVMGHSMGGMAATEACWVYRVFKACASLDGLIWAHEGNSPAGEQPNQVARTFLLLLSSQFLPPDLSPAAARYRRAWRDPRLCVLPRSRHNSASDLPLLRGTTPVAGELDPGTASLAVRRAALLFFTAALSGSPADSATPRVPPAPADTLVRSIPGGSPSACRLTGS